MQRTKLFFDTEFTGLHQKTTLISLGIASEDGQTFYSEFNDYDSSQLNPWLNENVIANLISKQKNDVPPHTNNSGNNLYVYGDTAKIKMELTQWLNKFQSVEMWSDCLAYDWVLFNNIFGDAFSLPDNVYYIPFDICTLFKAADIDTDISREEFVGNMVAVDHNWGICSKKHNSLWDAYVIRECYNKLIAIIKSSKPMVKNISKKEMDEIMEIFKDNPNVIVRAYDSEKSGQAIDRVDNMAHSLQLQLPPQMQIEVLKKSLPEIVQELKNGFVDATGDNPWQ